MNRNLTPRPIQATGARDAHGRILDPTSGAMYVHMHRESGLAHRHYVLKSWQVRLLAVGVSRPMLLLYLIALVTWGWMASQAARVPGLRERIATLTVEAQRLDTLTARLEDMRIRYEQVQKMLGSAAGSAAGPANAAATGAGSASKSDPAVPKTPGNSASGTSVPSRATNGSSAAAKADTSATKSPVPPVTPRPDSTAATLPGAAGVIPPGR